jgi:arsenite methyltransferase
MSIDLKSCCATAYEDAAVAWLVGDCRHPGGLALTDRLLDALALSPSSCLLDVATGTGASALRAARDCGCRVIGLDLGAHGIAAATEAACAANLESRTRFVVGDAEALPLDEASVDAVLCECALCLFPDPASALAEVVRVLRPGGRLALSDVTCEEPAALPAELRGTIGHVACLASARSLTALTATVAASGLHVLDTAPVNGAFGELLEQVESRLRMARMLRTHLPAEVRDRLDQADRLLEQAGVAIDRGLVGYAVVIAEAPPARSASTAAPTAA